MLDSIDTRLPGAIQTNAHLAAQEPGEMVHLSPSQPRRPRQRLESAGHIRGCSVRPVGTRPGIAGARTTTGEADCPLRACCADLLALDTSIRDAPLPT